MKIRPFIHLMRLHKPIGILLLLWPTLWALWLASAGNPAHKIVIIFILGVVLMRSAGCIINDYADRRIDKWVTRTRERPLTTGLLTPRSALILFACLCLLSFGLVLFLNPFTQLLAFIGFLLATVYPFMKRYTHLPQIGLGLAFAWGIPMAFAAENNRIEPRAWLIYLAAIIWTMMYDTLYAMVDREDDLKIGVKSTAILFGQRDRFFIGVLQGVFLFLLSLIGILYTLQSYYFFSLLLVCGFFIYQQCLISERQPDNCFKAFLNNHWVGMIIFCGIALS